MGSSRRADSTLTKARAIARPDTMPVNFRGEIYEPSSLETPAAISTSTTRSRTTLADQFGYGRQNSTPIGLEHRSGGVTHR